MASALDELGAEDRALVELAEVRGIGDEEMAGYLGVAPEEARGRRQAALERLASNLGVSTEEARAELSDALPPAPERGAAAPATPPKTARDRPEPRGSRAAPPPAPGGRASARSRSSHELRRRRSAALFAVLGIALLAGALTIALASGDGGSDERPAAGDGAAAPVAGPKVELAPPGPGPGTGTAQVLEGGDRVQLSVSGLPDPRDARYALWLYNSVVAARQIGSADSGDFNVEARLPRNAERYELLDVSLEPDDGNPGHSGQSVLRVPVRKLLVQTSGT